MTTQEWWTELKSVTLHDGTEPAPQLWPHGASDGYIKARQALLKEEIALRDQIEAVAQMRRDLPEGTTLPVYELTEGPLDLSSDVPPHTVALLDLFGDHDTLVIYHLMFHPDDDQACAMCSLWVDGLHGVSHHTTRRTSLAIVARAPIEKLRRWGRRRGWDGLRLVSSYGSTFSRDLHFENATGGQWPSVGVFSRDGGTVRHEFSQCADLGDRERGIDLLSPVWNVFDLLPQGRGNWLPDNTYPGRERR